MQVPGRSPRGRKGALGGGMVAPAALIAALLLPSLAVVTPGSIPRAEAAFPGRNGRIVFAASSVPPLPLFGGGGFDFDLFSVSPSGSAPTRVTEGTDADDFDPAWSPGGRRIVFARTTLGSGLGLDIYVLEHLGGEATNLTATPLENDYSPSWSPDGTRIVFTSERLDPAVMNVGPLDADLYVMDSDGGNVVQLTHDPRSQSDAAWSPRGDVIALVDADIARIQRGTLFIDGASIRLIGLDGSDRGVVVPFEMGFISLTNLSWSPNGRKLAFYGDGDIWVVNRDGSGLSNLTGTPGGPDAYSPSWSPDGRWIAFVSDRADLPKLYKMRPDGSNPTLLIEISVRVEAGGTDWGPRP